MQDDRWIEISPSQFPHERAGLEHIKKLLPDRAPFRAWANFEFRDNRGRWHEVDLLVVAADTVYLIELKAYKGVLRGNDHVWHRAGRRPVDSPLLLARRKAQYFSSLLKERLEEKTGQRGAGKAIPYVQELVFLHHRQFVCELPASSKINIYGLDGCEQTSGLTGIGQRLLQPPTRAPISEERSLLISDLMEKIGLAPRRQREVGSWVIDEESLGSGEGWQDWAAFHHVDTERHARIRFYLTRPGATSTEQHAQTRAIEQEYRLLNRLHHDGLQVPVDVVKEPELGIGLVFPRSKENTRLDLWLAEHRGTLTLHDQLKLIAEIAEIILYAHRRRVVHRTLNPHAIAVRDRGNSPQPLVTDWDAAGVLPANSGSGVTRLTAGALSLMSGALSDQAWLYAAPEEMKSIDPAPLDVFGVGALAYFILTGGQAPATDRGSLRDRLRRENGLDLAADMPQVPTVLRQWVLEATNPVLAQRFSTMADLLDGLEDVRHELTEPDAGADPLEAGPGDELGDGRFEVKRRLGTGSTAVGILVADRHAVGAERVLKVARDNEAASRLHDEAHLLSNIDDPRIVKLASKVSLGSRAALVLHSAGRTTLAEELSARGVRLSINLLERWGTDLLQALVALERAGVMHRDLKPANLGVHSSTPKAASHLVVFDFSMAGVDPKNLEAGTPPYLDPFLGLNGRRQYDTAAERYGAAVVLFEMATGQSPQYGADPQVHAATINDDVTVTPDMFEPAVAEALTNFFIKGLSRNATDRADTAEDMLRDWRQVFADVDKGSAPKAAAKVTMATTLSAAGLGARALSALAAVQVTTVGELVTLDPARLNRLVAKEARSIRTEITEKRRTWVKDLDPTKNRLPTTGPRDLLGIDDAVALLLDAVGTRRDSTRRRAAALLLGAQPGVDAFASGRELAAALEKTVPRGQQILKELQADWGKDDSARTLLDGVLDVASTALRNSGGVVAISTLTAEIRGRLPQAAARSDDLAEVHRRERMAAGLLRVAYDRLTEHEAADGDRQLVRRRHAGRLALVADDEKLLAAAEAAAARADELVVGALSSGTTDGVVPAGTAVRELTRTFAATYRSADENDAPVPLPSDARLVRLAAAISRHTAVSGRGELHSRTMEPAAAIKLALSGLAQTEKLIPREVQSRVAARFPDLDRLPSRPHLDAMVERAGLGLHWDGAESRYRYAAQAPPSQTSVHSRQPTNPGPSSKSTDLQQTAVARRDVLTNSLRENGFVVVGVPVRRPGDHSGVAHSLAEQHHGELLDVTGAVVAAMRDFAAANGLPWDLVRSADAAAVGSRDARGLRAVLDQVMPQFRSMLEQQVFADDVSAASGPLVLLEVSPLARYGYLEILAQLSDLAAARRRPVWVVVPQLHGQRGALVDGKPVQLGSPGGQFVVWSAPADANTAPAGDAKTGEAV